MIQSTLLFKRLSQFLVRPKFVPINSSFFNRKSSFSIDELLKYLHFQLKNLQFIYKRAPLLLGCAAPGRPKIIIFQGKDLHCLSKNLHFSTEKKTHQVDRCLAVGGSLHHRVAVLDQQLHHLHHLHLLEAGRGTASHSVKSA